MIQYGGIELWKTWKTLGFKPCYKWMTFNTDKAEVWKKYYNVLNLVING